MCSKEVFTFGLFLCLKFPHTFAEFNLTILHTSDVHARFAQTNQHSGPCSEDLEKSKKCYGGFARLHHKVSSIRAKTKNVIYLYAGDYYQGTAWTTIHRFAVVTDLVNILNHSAMALGNHEFDDNIPGILPFIDACTFPLVVSNIDATQEPEFQLRQTSGKVSKSTVLTLDNGMKVGIIGYILEETRRISSPGKLKFLNVISSVTKEAERLHSSGIQILIALGHAGFDLDRKLAAQVPHIDLVVGGHSNTFLYTGTPPDIEKPEGLYPFIVKNKKGKEVPIVHPYAFGKYLGFLEATFDDEGELLRAKGNPVLLDWSVPQDETMLARVNEWGERLKGVGKVVLGRTEVFLHSEKCRAEECNLGNAITDAIAYIYLKRHNHRVIAFANGGGIRGSIDNKSKGGNITMEDVLQILPFRNRMELMILLGSDLKQVFEHSVQGYTGTQGKFLQMSGAKVVYDLRGHAGKRVKSVKILSQDDSNQMKSVWESLDLNKEYKVAVTRFLGSGAEGYDIFKNKSRITQNVSNLSDTDMFAEYVKAVTVCRHTTEGRITFA